MAYTATLVKNNVSGNERVCTYNVTADATSGAVATPIGYVEWATLAPISMATQGSGCPRMKINLSAASAALNGSVMLSGCISGDNFFLTVYGRG